VLYHGKPARGLTGAGQSGSGQSGSGTSLYTSYFACDWMICLQDRFGDKAAFSAALHVPPGMETLSVGRRVARTPTPDGGEIHQWAAPRPYSAYLFGFAVGRFARVEERVGSARLAYLSDVADPAELTQRFAQTPDVVRFFADKAGAQLPVAEYSQLLVKGREAQERPMPSWASTPWRPTRTTPPRTGPSPTSWPTSGGAT
jgi:aminopeptidase N